MAHAFDMQDTQRHAANLRRLRQLRLLDDDFMTKVFEDIPCTQLLLRIILQMDDLHILRVQPQYTVKNLQGRSVRLDIFAQDSNGLLYNIEIQRDDKGAGARRARYNSSLLDANITEPGENSDQLPETYVIFITEHDVLAGGLPIYHIDRCIAETGVCFDDGAHIIYVNAQIKSETALGRLMHDFSCTNASDMHYAALASRVRYFKEDEEGVTSMCKMMEDLWNEGKLEGTLAANRSTALRMLEKERFSYEEIAELSGLSVEEVKALDEQRTA